MSHFDNLIRLITRFFRGKKFFYLRENIFSTHTENYVRAVCLMQVFYGLSFIMALSSYHWSIDLYTQKIYFKPLWIFYFFNAAKLKTIFMPAMCGWILGSALSLFYAEIRLFRWIQAFSLFLVVALFNSDGHYGHNNHAFLWLSILFAFAPIQQLKNTKETPRRYKHKLLLSIWFAQLIICTFYLMSGFWKVASIVNCAINPALTCQLDRWILTNITAREAIYYHQFAPWRDAFYKYPWISFISYMATIWVHLVSLYFVFRLDLHKCFGVIRLIFHLGTFLFFGVNFSAMAWPVGLIFLFSPFARTTSVKNIFSLILGLPPMSFFIRARWGLNR